MRIFVRTSGWYYDVGILCQWQVHFGNKSRELCMKVRGF